MLPVLDDPIAGLSVMICPECRGPIPRGGWVPYNVRGTLTIAWNCSNGHSGQHNGVDMILPPRGRPPAGLPPLAPVDLDPN